MQELVRLNAISKSFAGVRALEKVELQLQQGEILALVGENGAGKSTLMKILSGVYPRDEFEGEILIRGKSARFRAPADAEQAGIAIIHQELSQFGDLTVAENLFVGHWPTRWRLINWDLLNKSAHQWLVAVGAPCRAEDRMQDLSVGVQQIVEIAKALSRKSEILILDEPTSALTPSEIKRLFQFLQKLKEEGKGLIYISHRMEEIFELSDRVVVLRDGRSVFSSKTAETNPKDLIHAMVGRTLDRLFPQRYPPKRDCPDNSKITQIGKRPILEVKDFEGYKLSGQKLFGPLNFELYPGEILGFAGLLGARRTESMRALLGDPTIETRGEILVNQKPTHIRNPRWGVMNHIIYLSEDRKGSSILPQRSLSENVSLMRLSQKRLVSFVSHDDENQKTQSSLSALRTRCTGPEQEIRFLSGGNQQKVVIGRALQANPQIMILDEPTRGIDVGAKFEIYEILVDLAAKGLALILISSDLPELINLCDRIIVLAQGQQRGELQAPELVDTEIMKLAVQ